MPEETTIDSNLTVTGDQTVEGDGQVDGALTVTGDTTVGNLTATGTLTGFTIGDFQDAQLLNMTASALTVPTESGIYCITDALIASVSYGGFTLSLNAMASDHPPVMFMVVNLSATSVSIAFDSGTVAIAAGGAVTVVVPQDISLDVYVVGQNGNVT